MARLLRVHSEIRGEIYFCGLISNPVYISTHISAESVFCCLLPQLQVVERVICGDSKLIYKVCSSQIVQISTFDFLV